jgi:hypothetical protein
MRNTLQALLGSIASVALSVSVASATISMNPSHHKAAGQVVQGGGAAAAAPLQPTQSCPRLSAWTIQFPPAPR